MRYASSLARSHPLGTFFTGAFVISWLLWLPLVISHVPGDATSGPLWWVHYLGGFGPAISAVLTTALIGGRSALGELGRRLRVRGRAVAGWVVLGALLPVLLWMAVVPVIRMSTGAWPDLGGLLTTAKLPGLGIAGILVVEVVCFGLGEETGWRGFAWPRLRARHGFITSAALITVPWALWHLPTFVYNENMRSLGVGGGIGWLLSLFTGSVILGWLVDGARGCILPAVLFHGVLDVVFVSTAVAGSYDAYLGAAVTVFACGLLLAQLAPTVRARRRPEASAALPGPRSGDVRGARSSGAGSPG